MNLQTGKKIHGYRFTELAMPQHIIDTVHDLADAEDAPDLDEDGCPFFEWELGAPVNAEDEALPPIPQMHAAPDDTDDDNAEDDNDEDDNASSKPGSGTPAPRALEPGSQSCLMPSMALTCQWTSSETAYGSALASPPLPFHIATTAADSVSRLITRCPASIVFHTTP